MYQVSTRVSNILRRGFFSLLILLSFSLYAQKSRQQLEKEKRENIARIAEAQNILNETEKEKEATLGQLQAIQNQIRTRTALIRSMKSEIDFLEGEITDKAIVVRALENDLINLKKEYAEMIYSAYKANQGYSTLTFLFSSSTFNQLFMRLKYLKQYAEARKTQAEQIEIVAVELLSQKTEVQTRKEEQQVILSEQLAENQKLMGLKTKQKTIVTELSTKQTKLKNEVDKRKKSIARLDKLIAEVIEKGTRNADIGDVVDNASFEEMKGRLKWPVASGFFSARFGRQPHPVLANIEVENSGVRIQTNKGETVRSVSAGVVTRVADIPGMQRVIIVRHGQYLTVYGNLNDVKVTTGQTLSKNDVMGTVYTDSDGLTQLEFQVRKGRDKLNPEKWLAKK